MLSLFVAALSATNPAPIAGASLWLNYDRPVSTATRSKITIKSIVCPNSTANEITGRACQELSDGLAGLLGSRPTTLPTSGTQPVGNMVVLAPKSLAAAPWPPLPDKESFEIKYSPEHGAPIHISSDNAAGTLYGVFRFLHLLRRENMTTSASSAPALPLRSWNLWDNRDRSIERGYAGTSVFDYDAFPTMLPRYRDYARLLASVGINVIVWDNVNACAKGNEDMLKPDVITAMAPIVALFYQHGIRSFLVPCYSSPIKVGGLPNADPKDATVAKWWADTAALIQHTWSTDGRTNAFGGFLIKADCEGEPGPDTYNVTELEGANLLADALGPVDGIAIWRAFAHPPKGTDQAIWQFDLFKDWNKENATRANVVLQIKSGPYDFQVREPPHSLFGALNNVNLIIEFEATQEYLGQARHVCHLAPQWSWYMNFDTHCPVPTQTSSSSSEIEVSTLGTTIADVVGGKLRPAPYNKRPRWTGIAAVSNLGSEVTWTHHPMSAANTYSFGRIAWAPTLDPEEITREWVEATFGVGNATVTNVVMDIMTSSWIAYENYTASLGWGFACDFGHYNMDPKDRNAEYINASQTHIGFARAEKVGGAFAATYNAPIAAALENVDTCREDLLLSFHNVPYTHVLKGSKYGGLNVGDWIHASHTAGAKRAAGYAEQWSSLALSGGALSPKYLNATTGLSFEKITALLQHGADDAATFSNTIIAWLDGKMGKPTPAPSPSPPPPPSPPTPSPYPGFGGHASHFCSTGNGGKRFFISDSMSPRECATGCAGNATCACFDLSQGTTKPECRWVDAKFDLKGSGDKAAFTKEKGDKK